MATVKIESRTKEMQSGAFLNARKDHPTAEVVYDNVSKSS